MSLGYLVFLVSLIVLISITVYGLVAKVRLETAKIKLKRTEMETHLKELQLKISDNNKEYSRLSFYTLYLESRIQQLYDANNPNKVHKSKSEDPSGTIH